MPGNESDKVRKQREYKALLDAQVQNKAVAEDGLPAIRRGYQAQPPAQQLLQQQQYAPLLAGRQYQFPSGISLFDEVI